MLNTQVVLGYNLQISTLCGAIQRNSQIQDETNMYISELNALYIIILLNPIHFAPSFHLAS